MSITAPRQVRKGGVCHGYYYFLYCCRCGWCSLSLHQQMVRRRQIVGNKPMVLSLPYQNRNRKPRKSCTLSGFSLAVRHGLLFPFVYRHYSICKNDLQYAHNDYMNQKVTVQPFIYYIRKPASKLSVVAMQLEFTSFHK